jgi:hypothetical protein
MNRRSRLTLSTAALLCLCAASSAWADETLKYRQFTHATNVQTIDVGDVDGHLLGVNRQSGIASFPDGSVATAYLTAVTDYVKGSGTALVAYTNVTFEDGSVLWIKGTNTTVAEGNKSIISKGTLTVIGGKGRYAGATGDGTFSGVRLAPLATGADLYLDYTVNVKK